MSVKIKYMHDTCSETEAVKDMWKLYYELYEVWPHRIETIIYTPEK